jgi:hypothetical protein
VRGEHLTTLWAPVNWWDAVLNAVPAESLAGQDAILLLLLVLSVVVMRHMVRSSWEATVMATRCTNCCNFGGSVKCLKAFQVNS